MSAFSDYLEAALINATLRGGTYTGGGVYVALFKADPTDAGTGAEVTTPAMCVNVPTLPWLRTVSPCRPTVLRAIPRT